MSSRRWRIGDGGGDRSKEGGGKFAGRETSSSLSTDSSIHKRFLFFEVANPLNAVDDDDGDLRKGKKNFIRSHSSDHSIFSLITSSSNKYEKRKPRKWKGKIKTLDLTYTKAVCYCIRGRKYFLNIMKYDE